MSQPTQVLNNLPDGSYSVIDNSSAPAFPTLNAGTGLGYDTTAPGAIAQGKNTFKNGTVLLDSTTDAAVNTFNVATVVGNPVSNISPTGKVLTTVLNSSLSTRLLHKNPA
jgi:hypothetical protein